MDGSTVGKYIGLFISVFVLVLVLGALWGPLNSALADYAANETTFGPTVQTVTPIFLGVGVLIAIIYGVLRVTGLME